MSSFYIDLQCSVGENFFGLLDLSKWAIVAEGLSSTHPVWRIQTAEGREVFGFGARVLPALYPILRDRRRKAKLEAQKRLASASLAR
jgi:hypothetical protein